MATFVKLLEDIEPELCAHLCRLGAAPVAIALPWLAAAFVDVLPVQEVLQLWDRVIGFDDVMLLPAAAAAVLAWRSQALRACGSAAEVSEVLRDLEQIRIVPLLQALLFLCSPRS